MATYFSKTRGFQLSELHGTKIALDAIKLSDEEYRDLINGQTSGKSILVDPAGRPYLADGPTMSLEEAKKKKISIINTLYEKKVFSLQGAMTASEVGSWTDQKTEALAYLTDPMNATVPMIRAIAEARGLDLAILARKIIQKAETYSAEHGRLMGKRQALEKLITNAKTVKGLDFIKWVEDDLVPISNS